MAKIINSNRSPAFLQMFRKKRGNRPYSKVNHKLKDLATAFRFLAKASELL